MILYEPSKLAVRNARTPTGDGVYSVSENTCGGWKREKENSPFLTMCKPRLANFSSFFSAQIEINDHYCFIVQ